MEENKQKELSWKNIALELLTMAIISVAIFGHGCYAGKSQVIILRNIVMCLLGIAVVGFHYRQEFVANDLDYNNNEHPFLFWVLVWFGSIVSFVSVFLPVAGWPIMPVFVLLSLFSNLNVGVLASSVLLMLSVFLTDASVGVFFLYFISGIFAAGLFKNLKSEFTIGVPWFLSIICLLVCETANIVLTANKRLNYEQFLVPVANLMVSSVLLLGILKFFSGKVIYRYRSFYLEWNDTTNPILAEFKKKDKNSYLICVHTAYFCERIAKKLLLDADALKCAGYYHKLKKEFGEYADANAKVVPPAVLSILKEYHTANAVVLGKETAVLVYADAVVSSITFLASQNKDKKIDYDQIVDTIFKKFQDEGTFRQCNITMQEIDTIQKIFKEDKLYYDFLCGE